MLIGFTVIEDTLLLSIRSGLFFQTLNSSASRYKQSGQRRRLLAFYSTAFHSIRFLWVVSYPWAWGSLATRIPRRGPFMYVTINLHCNKQDKAKHRFRQTRRLLPSKNYALTSVRKTQKKATGPFFIFLCANKEQSRASIYLFLWPSLCLYSYFNELSNFLCIVLVILFFMLFNLDCCCLTRSHILPKIGPF